MDREAWDTIRNHVVQSSLDTLSSIPIYLLLDKHWKYIQTSCCQHKRPPLHISTLCSSYNSDQNSITHSWWMSWRSDNAWLLLLNSRIEYSNNSKYVRKLTFDCAEIWGFISEIRHAIGDLGQSKTFHLPLNVRRAMTEGSLAWSAQ